MSARHKVFFCAPTGEGVCTEGYTCGCGLHTRKVVGRFKEAERPAFPIDKSIKCPSCGAKVEISSQGWSEIFVRSDTGEEVGGAEKLPVGACWAYSTDYDYPKGPDGRSLNVMLPDGTSWFIDGKASNCTMPDDEKHRCWVRHGRPEDGTLHVDKNGRTCQAGAGSIATRRYHGFLHHGELVEC